MQALPMQTLPAPPGAHIAMRRAVRHPRELLALVIAILGSLVLLIVAINEVGAALDEHREANPYALIMILGPLIVWFVRGQLWSQQRLGGIRLSPTQFPQVHAMLVDAAARAGMSFVPDAYVVLGNGAINAAASGHGRRRYIFIYSDLLEVGGAARDPEALRFIIAHEVGHIAAGHTSYWRMLSTFASNWIPLVGSTLSRAQEYTADNYGHALVPEGSKSAMATLAGGKYLLRSVDVHTMADRATVEDGFFVWVTNALASHPVLLWRMHALRDRRAPGRLLWRPTTPWPGQRLGPSDGMFPLPAMIGFEPTPWPGEVDLAPLPAPVDLSTLPPPRALSDWPSALQDRRPGDDEQPEDSQDGADLTWSPVAPTPRENH